MEMWRWRWMSMRLMRMMTMMMMDSMLHLLDGRYLRCQLKERMKVSDVEEVRMIDLKDEEEGTTKRD
jgi:hypothetical protein